MMPSYHPPSPAMCLRLISAKYLFVLVVVLFVFVQIIPLDAQDSGSSFLDVTIDSLTPYVGQPTIYTWQLFLPAGMNAESAQITLPPFTGFGQENLPAGDVQLQTVNGQSMQVVQRQIVLYPLQTGTFTIEALQILLPETPFQSAVPLSSPPFAVNVLPMPPNAPVYFQNAIGQFDVAAALNVTSIAVGQPVILTMTITGTGNIQQVLRPKMVLPEFWRIFEQDNPVQPASPVFGSRVFEWQLIPAQAGIHVIPALEFGFLNPQTGSYETRTTTPLPIEVLAADNPTTSPPISADVTQTTHSQPDIMLKPLPENIASRSTNFDIWGLVLWLLPPLGAGLVAFMSSARSRRNPSPKPERLSGSRALQQAQMQLKTALSQSPKDASVMIADIILTYLSRKTGQSIQRETLKNALSGLSLPVQKTLLDCLDHADAGRYAPVSEQDIKLLVRDTLRILLEIDKTWQA